MKKCLLICSFLLTAGFFTSSIAFNVNSYKNQLSLRIPQPVLKTAWLWACDHGILPETAAPDYQRAFYTQMSKHTWEVHWMWSKGGIQGEVRLLITNGGTLLDEY